MEDLNDNICWLWSNKNYYKLYYKFRRKQCGLKYLKTTIIYLTVNTDYHDVAGFVVKELKNSAIILYDLLFEVMTVCLFKWN